MLLFALVQNSDCDVYAVNEITPSREKYWLGISLFFGDHQLVSRRSSVLQHDLKKQDDLLTDEMFYLSVTLGEMHLCLRRRTRARRRRCYISNRMGLIYLTEPLCEGRDAGEDCGLLHFVANAGGNKAGHTLDVPPPILTQTVKRTARVPLRETSRGGIEAWSSWPRSLQVIQFWQAQAAFFWCFTHIASRHDVSSCADHGALDGDPPPVTAAAHAVLHHRQQGLLQFIRHGAMSWHTEDRAAQQMHEYNILYTACIRQNQTWKLLLNTVTWTTCNYIALLFILAPEAIGYDCIIP